MASIFQILKDGGVLISYVIILLLLVNSGIFIKSIVKKKSSEKSISLISSIAWFALAWGFLGRTLGLIHSFDTIEAKGELFPFMIAEGIKMALVGPLLGISVFLISRLLIILLISRQNNYTEL